MRYLKDLPYHLCPPQQVAEIFESEEKQLVNSNADSPAAAPQAAEGAPPLTNDSGGAAAALSDPAQVIGNIGANGIAEANNTQSEGGYIELTNFFNFSLAATTCVLSLWARKCSPAATGCCAAAS